MHGGDWAALDAITRSQLNLLDLSSSISPYGPGPKARRLWPSLVDHLDRYPDWRNGELTKTLAMHLKVDPDQVLITAGAMEAIDLVIQSFRPGRIWIVVPAFGEYERRAQAHGVVVQWIEEGQELPASSGMLFLANPANPTGRLLSPADLQAYVRWASDPDHILVVDEAFIEFVKAWPNTSLVADAAGLPRIVVLGSLTKFYGLAGLRVGFIVARGDHVQKIAAQTLTWHVSLVAQEMAVASLQDGAYFDATRLWIQDEKKRLQGLLRPFGRIDCTAQANYFLFSPYKRSVSGIVAGLQAQGILVRDAGDFKGLEEPAIRIAVKRPQDSDRLAKALEYINDQ